MKIINPFQMNDWDIKNLFNFIIIIQILLWITAGLTSIGIHIPIISETVAFISLIFINGVLILRILRIHALGNIESILYSIGLSVAVVMFLGMIIDLLYPFLGIKYPITVIPLLITFTVFTLFLCIVTFYRDEEFNNPDYIDLTGLTNPMIFLSLIPFLAIFGTCAINNYQNNIILILMFVLIAIIPIMVVYDKFIPKELYPMTIFSLSISLLFSTSLITNYITGWDINLEYYFSNLVVTNSYWNASLPEILNSMLSLVIFVPIFSKISGLNVVGIFKIIYPIIFAFVPLGLYTVYKKQTNNKIAFIGCFLFISVFMFFVSMPYLARQEIGELFVVLMVMLMVEKNLSNKHISILTLFFIPAILVSHYSLDYIYIFLLLCTYLIISIRNLNLTSKFGILERWEIIKFFFAKRDSQGDDSQGEFLKIDYRVQIVLIISFTLIYYIFVSSSALFNLTVFTLNNLITIGYQYIFNPSSLAAVGIVTSEKTFLRTIALVIHLAIEFLIGIGILLFMYRRLDVKLNENYGIFSVMSFLMLFLVLFVPFLAGALNPERFYQIALIFLSVFFVLGWIGFFKIFNRILKFKWKKKKVYDNSLKLVAIFLAVSLMFNSGVAYEVFKDKPTSISLHGSMDGPKFNDMEVIGAQWLSTYKINATVYADNYRHLLLNGFDIGVNEIFTNNTQFKMPFYMFLGTYNIKTNHYVVLAKGSGVAIYFDYDDTLLRNRTYDNGAVQVFVN